MLKFSKNTSFKEQNIVKENVKSFGIFKNIWLFHFQSLITYSTKMCWRCPCTTVCQFQFFLFCMHSSSSMAASTCPHIQTSKLVFLCFCLMHDDVWAGNQLDQGSGFLISREWVFVCACSSFVMPRIIVLVPLRFVHFCH